MLTSDYQKVSECSHRTQMKFGKVMFPQTSVCPGQGLCPEGSLSRGVSVQGLSVQGSLCLGESQSRWCLNRGGLCPGGSLSEDPLQLCEGSTHPTGMHFC